MTNIDETPEGSQSIQSAPFFQSEAASNAAPSGAMVWPPSIEAMGMDAQVPAVSLPLYALYQKVQGNVSDVREGALQIGSPGIGVVGRALPRAEIMQTILIFGVLINLFIALLAFLIMRYGCMQPYNVFINWNEITEIIIDKQRKRFGLSYNGLNYKGKAMQFSICTRASTADVDLFEQYAVANAPTITHAGRLRSATSIVAWVVLAFIVAGFAFGFLYVAFGHH